MYGYSPVEMSPDVDSTGLNQHRHRTSLEQDTTDSLRTPMTFSDSSRTLIPPEYHGGGGAFIVDDHRALLANTPHIPPSYTSEQPADIADARQRLLDPHMGSENQNYDRYSIISNRSTLNATPYDSSYTLVSTHKAETKEHNTQKENNGLIKLILISISLCLAVICLALDNTIIATAIPKITDTFGARSTQNIGWFGSAYLLTTSAFQLFYGRMYTYFCMKRVYLSALFLFEAGSLVCALAPNATIFILGRAIAGVGTAGVYTGSYLIIESTIPRKTRPTFTGFIGAAYAVASVAGPIVGGAFSQHLTWRWCFYINLPIGALTAIGIFFCFHPEPPVKTMRDLSWKAKIMQFDPLGTVLILGSVTTLLIALQDGGSKYNWDSAVIIALLIISAVLAVVFGFIQFWQGENGTIPIRILKRRTVAAACFYAVFLGGTYFISAYYIPIWFQMVKGKSPVDAGVASVYTIISEVTLSIVTGILVSKIGYYAPFILISSILMPIGSGLLSTIHPDTNLGVIIAFELVLGAGIGSGSQHIQTAIQTVLQKEDIPKGTALATFAQSMGGSVFLSVAQSIFMNRLNSELKGAGIKPSDAGMLESMKGVTDLLMPQVQNSYNTALRGAFLFSTGLAAASLVGAAFVEWKSIKTRALEDEAEGEKHEDTDEDGSDEGEV